MLRVRIGVTCWIYFAVGLLFAVNAESESNHRIALVIGNGAYQTITPLKNPPNDAELIAQTLRDAGFSVDLHLDANYRDMRRAIRDFGMSLDEKSEALFYYAGHGVQYDGNNYLVPVDAKVVYEEDINVESVDLEMVLSKMQGSRSRVNIVILDACRNNPFAGRSRSLGQGLAYVSAPTGSLIAYATAPGSVAFDGVEANSTYSKNLATNILKKELEIEDVFKATRSVVRQETNNNQVPWESSSLEGDYYFFPSSRPVAASFQGNPDQRGQLIQNALSRGRQLYEKGVFLSDDGIDATANYRTALLLDPSNVEAKAKLESMAGTYVGKTLQAMAIRDLDSALMNLGYAMQIDASYGPVIDAQKNVVKMIETLSDARELDKAKSEIAKIAKSSEQKMAAELTARDELANRLDTEIASMQQVIEAQRNQINELVKKIESQESSSNIKERGTASDVPPAKSKRKTFSTF